MTTTTVNDSVSLAQALWDGRTIRLMHVGGTKYWDVCIRRTSRVATSGNPTVPSVVTRWGAVRAGIPDLNDTTIWSNFTRSYAQRAALKEAASKIRSKLNRGYVIDSVSRIPLDKTEVFSQVYGVMTTFDSNVVENVMVSVKKEEGKSVVATPVARPGGAWDIL